MRVMSQLLVEYGKFSIPKSQLCVEFFDQLVVETSSNCTLDQQHQWKFTATSDTQTSSVTCPGEQVRYSTDVNEASQSKPKRPMNAFMVWAQMIRRELHRKFGNVQNALLSKSLGRVWRTLDAAQKEPFIERANWIKSVHKHNYPNYRYQPRRLNKPKALQTSQQTPPASSAYHYYDDTASCNNATQHYSTACTEYEAWNASQVAWHHSSHLGPHIN